MPICPKCRGENPELGAKCPRDGYYYIDDDALDEADNDEWLGKLAAEKYVVLSLISEGGMGAVYRAMQLPVQREVAFKVLRAELQDSDQGHDRFAREARAVSQLTHPNIITMHDFGVDSGGHPFMVMEYAPGKSLADWIVQPGLKLDRISHVFRQILSALSEAHNQGIVHRDLKPENLIVTRTGSDEDYIKLLDFGIARMVHDGATRGLTKEGEVFGTPHYMAPEQAQGKKNIGPPADVYALGIMLYEMLVGQCPFDAPTPLSILYMHINDDLPELEPRGGVSVPDAVREVVNRATAKKADERYANAGEMLAAFDEAIGNTTGKYVAPASSSSESITATQRLGSQQHPQKATAETLNFGEAGAALDADKATDPLDPKHHETDKLDSDVSPTKSAQHNTSSSNAVPINDPEETHTITAELEAMNAGGSQRTLIVAAALVLLIGAGGAFAFLGGDTKEVDANEQVSGNVDQGSTADDSQNTGDEQAGSEQAPADEQPNAEGSGLAATGDDNAAEEKPADPTPDLLDDEGEPATGTANADDSADPAPATAAVNSGNNEPQTGKSPTRGSNAPPSQDVPPKSPAGQSSNDAPSPQPAAGSSNTASSNADSKEDDAPAKFQPKKFEPKTDSDDDKPEKFEPRKWR